MSFFEWFCLTVVGSSTSWIARRQEAQEMAGTGKLLLPFKL